ncbi:MAG: virulence factor [Arenicellales bacterium]|jgi:hypothetical protein
MAKLITVYWRDIPAQVIGKAGRTTFKKQLSDRFQQAIDRAAMRAGRGSSDAYLSEWRRESREVAMSDLQAEVDRVAQEFETSISDEDLTRLIRSKGNNDVAASNE